MNKTEQFIEKSPSNESYLRAIILFGRNVATYKFALAEALFDLRDEGKTYVSAEELAIPFSKHLCEHLKQEDKQGTSTTSHFLQACRQYISGKIPYDMLLNKTVQLGFNNVLDAFHIVNGLEIAKPFFVKQSVSNKGGIILTDELYKLKNLPNAQNLRCEIEARWRLVETAWNLGISTSSLAIKYDSTSKLFLVEENHIRRKNITSAKHALSGYQKGKCFYCFKEIYVSDGPDNNCDVDHFIPYTLQPYTQVNLNGVWNLVLACPHCNRGPKGKQALLPELRYLERLNKRNNFLVNSHHPLRETIILQTGTSNYERQSFLNTMDQFAIEQTLFRWHPVEEEAAVF